MTIAPAFQSTFLKPTKKVKKKIKEQDNAKSKRRKKTAERKA